MNRITNGMHKLLLGLLPVILLGVGFFATPAARSEHSAVAPCAPVRLVTDDGQETHGKHRLLPQTILLVDGQETHGKKPT